LRYSSFEQVIHLSRQGIIWEPAVEADVLRPIRGSAEGGLSTAMSDPPNERKSLMGEKSKRGFASMDEQKQREIAAKGGRSVPDEKRSFSRNRELASEAGAKGGQNVPDEKRSFSQDRELAAQAGRKGGQNVPDEKRSFSQDRELAAQAGRKGGQSGSEERRSSSRERE
jgi:general stress protein YciG